MSPVETRTNNPVGKSVPRIDVHEKVTGAAIYCDDIQFGAGLLHARVKRSPHPHAIIKRLDVSKARALPGVKIVVTGEDYGDRTGLYIRDKYPFARERVRFVGEAVAAVAATSEEIAEKALDLIDVEYELLPALFDPTQSVAIRGQHDRTSADLSRLYRSKSGLSIRAGRGQRRIFGRGDLEFLHRIGYIFILFCQIAMLFQALLLLDDDFPAADQRAADVLADWIKKMTGAELSIADSPPAGSPAILVGAAAVEAGLRLDEIDSPSREGLRVLCDGRRVLLAGQNDHATIKAACRLLEHWGCRYYLDHPLGEVFPACRTLSVAKLDLKDALSKRSFGARYQFVITTNDGAKAQTKNVIFLNNLMPINFLFYGVPSEIIDQTLAQLISVTANLHRQAPKINRPRVFAVDYDRIASENVYGAIMPEHDIPIPRSS